MWPIVSRATDGNDISSMVPLLVRPCSHQTHKWHNRPHLLPFSCCPASTSPRTHCHDVASESRTLVSAETDPTEWPANRPTTMPTLAHLVTIPNNSHIPCGPPTSHPIPNVSQIAALIASSSLWLSRCRSNFGRWAISLHSTPSIWDIDFVDSFLPRTDRIEFTVFCNHYFHCDCSPQMCAMCEEKFSAQPPIRTSTEKLEMYKNCEREKAAIRDATKLTCLFRVYRKEFYVE